MELDLIPQMQALQLQHQLSRILDHDHTVSIAHQVAIPRGRLDLVLDLQDILLQLGVVTTPHCLETAVHHKRVCHSIYSYSYVYWIQWNAATIGEQRGCFVHKLFIWDLGA